MGAVAAPKAGEKGLAKSGGTAAMRQGSDISCPGKASAACQPRRGGGGGEEAEEEHVADVTATEAYELLSAQERSSHCGGVGGDKVRSVSLSEG